MSGHAGLSKVTKSVKGKKGMVRRSYWVRGTDAVKSGAKKLGSFVNRHKGKIAGAAALAGAAYLGRKHGAAIRKHGAAIMSLLGRAARSAHSAGVRKATSQYKAATHPDRAAQGKSNGRAAGAWGAVRGYAQGAVGKENMARAREAVGRAASRAQAAGGAVRSAASGAASRVARAAYNAKTRAKGNSTSRELTIRR